MENLISLDMVVKNESLLKGRLFTEMQLDILKKKLKRKPLNVNEKTYYYKFIKPKVKAMMSFFDISDLVIKGKEDIIKGRIDHAFEFIRKLEQKYKNRKILVSGSFLFCKEYRDIDVFIFTKYNKEDYVKGKLHITFLPEGALESLFFSSLSKISISNFMHPSKNVFDIGLNEILQTYELLINAILNEEDYENLLRDFILQTEYVSKSVVLNPKQLHNLKNKFLEENISIVSNTFINALILSYDKAILIDKLNRQISDYKKLLKDYKSAKNLGIYMDTYSKVVTLAA